jgi:hypothetical protein
LSLVILVADAMPDTIVTLGRASSLAVFGSAETRSCLPRSTDPTLPEGARGVAGSERL